MQSHGPPSLIYCFLLSNQRKRGKGRSDRSAGGVLGLSCGWEPQGIVGKVTGLMLPSQRIPPQGLFRVSHLVVLEREALGLSMSTPGRYLQLTLPVRVVWVR